MAVCFYVGMISPAGKGLMVTFPDFPDASGTARSFSDAIQTGEQLLLQEIRKRILLKQELPVPSPYEKIINGMSPGSRQKVICQHFRAPSTENMPVKRTLSIPQKVDTLIDQHSQRMGLNKSEFVSQAILCYCETNNMGE